MATTITGDPTTITTPNQKVISDATNASPIVITTTTDHAFFTGDTVVVEAVGGNTAANGIWTITVVDAVSFRLDGSTGSGAYTSGGRVTDYFVGPAFTVPDDGDDIDAASVNVALETLADRTQFLGLISRLQSKEFTASGTWTSPDICGSFAILVASGGGGGGGGGGTGSTSTSHGAAGGGGGGGAEQSIQIVGISPSTSYAVVVGAGGAGGTAGNAGSDGDNTTWAGTPIARGGGGGGGGSVLSTTDEIYIPGGSPAQGQALSYTSVSPYGRALPPHFGGCGKNQGGGAPAISSQAGAAAARYLGGAAASRGVSSGSYSGGGAGGGGGAGAFGNGGAAAAGGAGNNAGTGSNGSTGTAGATNTGAGGGGGGAGGQGSTAGGTGGTGGAGGSGKLTIYYFGMPT